MSNEIDVYQGPNEPAVYNVDPTGGRLVAWAEGLAAAHRIGSALCQTAFAPAHFKGKPEEAAAAIMFGDEVGLSPTQALRSIYVISGTPSLYARQMAALVLHHGHEVWTVEKSDAKVVVSGKRRGSQHTISETWTTARAQKAGYTNNKKYASDPQAMLYARALADVCRQIAPDALAGLAYTVEEMEINEPAPTQRMTRAKAAPAPMPEPDLEPATLTADEPIPTDPSAPEAAMSVPGADGITKAQLTKLHTAFTGQGITEREDRLTYVTTVLGFAVESSKDLSKADAHKVIESLETSVTAQGEEPSWT